MNSVSNSIAGMKEAVPKILARAKCIFFLIACGVINIAYGRYRHRSDAWIIGEGFGDCHKDNGYCFFRSCMTAQRNNVFFVVKRRIARRDPFLRGNANVLHYGSFRHINQLLYANAFIYTHTHRDIAYDSIFWLLSRRVRIVSLKHGIMGFKKVNSFYRDHCNEPDMVVAVSEFEKSIIANGIGTLESKIRITGLARYDFLTDKSHGAQRKILYMPTWRDWATKGSFDDSAFLANAMGLANNAALNELLAENDMTLSLFLHKNMSAFSPWFAIDHPNISFFTFGEVDLQDLINESSLLVTDYSSASWDFLYLGKPVIFFQFDREEYLERRGSYLDFKESLFGPSATTPDEVARLIHDFAANGFQLDGRSQDMRSRFFSYFDCDNCSRIRDEIDALVSARD